jgi:predicted nucleic acid-binding protein
MNKTYVLDASALLDFLGNGAGANRMAQLMREAGQSANPLLVSVVHWGEVFYLLWQRHGEQSARETINDLSLLPLRVLSLEMAQALKAAELKARHKIPYVDCLAAALAELQRATLVTADTDFKKLGRHFPILWLSR